MGLHTRLNLIIAMICFLALLLGSGAIVINARESVLDEISSSLSLAEKLMQKVPGQQQLAVLDQARHLRVNAKLGSDGVSTVLTGEKKIEGVPQFFSYFVWPEKERLRFRLAGEDYSNVITLEADPSDEIREAWREASVFISFLFAIMIFIPLSVFYVTGRALRPVGEILEAFSDVEKGDYRKRLSGFELPEFGQIAAAFNHMADKLIRTERENRRLSKKSLQVKEEERRYLARELHDEMGQSLSAIKVLSASAHRGKNDDSALLGKIETICDHLFDVVRGMMWQLSPPLLSELGLKAALEELIERWRNQGGCDVSLEFGAEVEALVADNDILFYRIVQESLTNIMKHSHAERVEIKLLSGGEKRGRAVQLRIEDDGIGFDPDEVEWGGGLAGIRERAESIGASFGICPGQRKGVSLVVKYFVE